MHGFIRYMATKITVYWEFIVECQSCITVTCFPEYQICKWVHKFDGRSYMLAHNQAEHIMPLLTPSSITNKMQRYVVFFITVNALHVSGSFAAHHQELKTVHTASGI
jgi:hypothetical protein